MIKQCKLAFRLLRYAFGLKSNIIAGVCMGIVGLVLEILTHGTNFLGSFFLIVLVMYPIQFLYSMSMSNEVVSSPYRKQLQTSMPTYMSLLLSVALFTVLIVIKMVESALYPEDAGLIMGVLLMIAFMQMLLNAYTAIVYKLFIAATIILFVLIYGVCFTIGFNAGIENTNVFNYVLFVFPDEILSPFVAIPLTYLMLVIGAVLQYLLSLAIYKRPLSKRAQGAAMKRYLS